MLNDKQAYVRPNGRLALYRQEADVDYWDTNWSAISDDTLRHILRPTKRLGVHHGFFWRHLPSTGLILEAGCGTGLWVRRLRENGWNCVGLDYALPSLVRSKYACSELPLMGGDVFHLPLSADCLAAYVSFGVVEHFLEGPGRILRECARVLRQGGVALISVPYDSPVRQNLQIITEQEANARGLEFYQYYFSQSDLEQELVLAGLEPTGSFHGYGVSGGLAGPVKFLRHWVRRLGFLAGLLDFVPRLPRLTAHMMFVAAIKPLRRKEG